MRESVVRRFTWQSGMSMVQGMVISAILAGSALVTTRVLSTQKKALKSSETKDAISEIHKQIFGALQNREHCLSTMNAINLATATPQSLTSIKTYDGGATQTIFQTYSGSNSQLYMNGNIKIKSMQVTIDTSNLGNPQRLDLNFQRLDNAADPDASKRGSAVFGGKDVRKTVWIRFQRATAASTSPSGCYAVELNSDSDTGQGNDDLNKTFCEKLGDASGGSLYTWDAVRNTCVLKNHECDPGYVFEGINSTGSAICRPFADYLPYFLQTGTNPCPSNKRYVKIVRDPGTGKISIQCFDSFAPTPPPSTCSASVVSWSESGNTCNSFVSAGSGPVSVTDSSAPTTGTGTATCVSGSWSVSGSCSSACAPNYGQPAGNIGYSEVLCAGVVYDGSSCCGNGNLFFVRDNGNGTIQCALYYCNCTYACDGSGMTCPSQKTPCN